VPVAAPAAERPFTADYDYDYEAEAEAVADILTRVAQLKRFGVDDADASVLPGLNEACTKLALLSEKNGGAPPLRDDPRLIGDWELVATTSKDLAERKGLTGLGSAPFTQPAALFYTHRDDGQIIAKEVLEFFGNPVVVNELRGKFGFDAGGEWMQEQYATADLSGVANSPQFTSATATTKGVAIVADGKMRVMFTNGFFFVFKKLGEGALNAWLQERRLPWYGGTIATLDTEAMAKAYPYLSEQQPGGAGGGDGGGGGGNPFGSFKMPWDK